MRGKAPERTLTRPEVGKAMAAASRLPSRRIARTRSDMSCASTYTGKPHSPRSARRTGSMTISLAMQSGLDRAAQMEAAPPREWPMTCNGASTIAESAGTFALSASHQIAPSGSGSAARSLGNPARTRANRPSDEAIAASIVQSDWMSNGEIRRECPLLRPERQYGTRLRRAQPLPLFSGIANTSVSDGEAPPAVNMACSCPRCWVW